MVTNKKSQSYFAEGYKTSKRTGYLYSEAEHQMVLKLLSISITNEDSTLEAVEAKFKPAFEWAKKLEWCPEIPGFCAYVLMCENGKMYKGYTANFKQRMLQHFNGRGCATTMRMPPAYILHHEEFDSKEAATAREQFFKSFEGRSWLTSTTLLKTIKP